MKVDIGAGPFEATMLIPIRFSDGQGVARSFQCWNVRWFVGCVRKGEQHVDSWFGSKARN